MNFISERIYLITRSLGELIRHGLPEFSGPLDKEVLFVVDGVGGFQFGVAAVRIVFREDNIPMGTVFYKWQFGVVGEIWTDLMWLRRNKVMGAKLARKILTFRRAHRDTTIHLLAISGGAGITVFACEYLQRRGLIDTFILAGPAISPMYNLAPALRAVNQCYALTSEKDNWILGAGTRLLGTTDRKYTSAGGMVGFKLPENVSKEDRQAYERFGEIRWEPSWKKEGHLGGHVSWVMTDFVRSHLVPILRGEPRFPVHKLT